MQKGYDSYLVTDEDLLYRLASCSLLDKLCGVTASKKVEGTRVWFFDKDPGVLNVINQYKSEKLANREMMANERQIKCDVDHRKGCDLI